MSSRPSSNLNNPWMHGDPAQNVSWKIRCRLKIRSFEHAVRNFLLNQISKRRGASSHPPPSPVQDQSHVKKILIIRTGKAIGDMVMSLVLIPPLRRLFPQACIHLLIRDHVAPFFMEGSGVDQIKIFYPKFLKHPKASFRLFKDLRQETYDLVFVCDHPWKSSMTTLCLALWTKAPWRVGFSTPESESLLTIGIKPSQKTSMVRNLLKFIEPFQDSKTIRNESLIPVLKISDQDHPLVNQLKNSVILFVASHWRKSESLAAFLSIANQWIEKGEKVILSFGPGDLRIHDPKVIAWQTQHRTVGTVLPPQSPHLFLQILKNSKLFISNDCGPYHLAVATGAPCMGIFLTEEARRDFGYHSPPKLKTSLANQSEL